MSEFNDKNESMDPINKHELDEETLFIVSQTFKALSDPTRIKILHLLSKKQHSVNEIAENLHML